MSAGREKESTTHDTSSSGTHFPATRAALGFLARLACGASSGALVEAWRSAAAQDGGVEVRRLASLLGLRGAAGRFVATLPATDLTRAARLVVGDAIRAEASTEAAVRVVLELVARASAGGVEAVVVKGAALRLAGLYAEGERDAADADLLVEPGTLQALHRAAEAAGLDWYDRAEGGYEAALVEGHGGLVEVHTALAGDAGRESGPTWGVVRPLAVPAADSRLDGRLLVLTGQPARELAVQHLVRHHDGDPMFALRTLQDLTRLEGVGGGEESGLPWTRDAAGLHRNVTRLRRLAGEIRDAGERLPEGPERFLERLGAAIASSREPDAEYAAKVDRWVRLQGGAGDRLALMFRSLREAPSGETGVSHLARPFRMLGRYLAGRARQASAGREAERAAAEWRAELERG